MSSLTEPILYCPHCDYNLTGLPNHRCPECGEEFDPQELITGRKDFLDSRPLRRTNIIATAIPPLLLCLYALFISNAQWVNRVDRIPFVPIFFIAVYFIGFASLGLATGTGMRLMQLRRSHPNVISLNFAINFLFVAVSFSTTIAILVNYQITWPKWPVSMSYVYSTTTVLMFSAIMIYLITGAWFVRDAARRVKIPLYVDVILIPITAALFHEIAHQTTRIDVAGDMLFVAFPTFIIGVPFMLLCEKVGSPTLPVFISLVVAFEAFLPNVIHN